MSRSSAALRRIGEGAESMEEVASRVVRYLRDELADPGAPAPDCALVRFYKTHRYDELEPDQQRFADAAYASGAIAADTKCLTLLASVGDEPGWSSRTASAGHKAIPLVGEQVIARAPMIAGLLSQLGVDVPVFLAPLEPDLLVEREQRSYNVFYVAEAAGSTFIPAQQSFVESHGIRSVLGFGGLLPSGDLFAVILFSRVPFTRETAELFKPLALSIKVAILPFVFRRIFS